MLEFIRIEVHWALDDCTAVKETECLEISKFISKFIIVKRAEALFTKEAGVLWRVLTVVGHPSTKNKQWSRLFKNRRLHFVDITVYTFIHQVHEFEQFTLQMQACSSRVMKSSDGGLSQLFMTTKLQPCMKLTSHEVMIACCYWVYIQNLWQ